MKFKIFILPFLVFLCFQLNAQKPEDQNFRYAYDEISSMLEGKQPLDFERAVFLTENAYRDNSMAYEDFQATLDISTEIIQQLIKANDGQDWRQYVRGTKVTPERELQVKARYQRALANWAIYTWMTDTVEVRLNEQKFTQLPLTYSNDDPFGTADWKNSQVLNLFESGKGNCYALVTLFKIFSERLKSEANIVTAPQHIHIEHIDPNGNRFNVELPTRSFPNMGSIQTLTYTTREGLLNDISMRSLDLKQSVGLSLIYLAKGYQNKYQRNTDEFLLTCANKVLEHDPKNLNALLLKAEVYEQRVMNHQMDASNYESLLTDLYKLGYRQMPDDMREVILSRIQGRQTTTMLADKSPNPYQNIGEQSRYVTLSNGLFDEVHQSQKIVKYGRTTFDTEKKKIAKFLEKDVFSYQVDPVVFALSVDPLAGKYADMSPYSFTLNNPIVYIDPDGQDVVLSEAFRKLFIQSFRIFKQSDLAKRLLNTWAHTMRGDYYNNKNGALSRHTLEFNNGGDWATWTFGGGLTSLYVQNSDGVWDQYNESTQIVKSSVFKLQLNIQGGMFEDADEKGHMAAILNHEAFLWANVYTSWIEKWEKDGLSDSGLKKLFGNLAYGRRYAGILDPNSDIQKAHLSTIDYLKDQVRNTSGSDSDDWKELLQQYMGAREKEIDTMGRKHGGDDKADNYLKDVRQQHTNILKEIK